MKETMRYLWQQFVLLGWIGVCAGFMGFLFVRDITCLVDTKRGWRESAETMFFECPMQGFDFVAIASFVIGACVMVVGLYYGWQHKWDRTPDD